MSEADAMGLPEEALPPIKERDCFFWMVWCDGGREPTLHVTEERAMREARRLARKVLGKRFYVLKGYRSFKCRGEPRPEQPIVEGVDPRFLVKVNAPYQNDDEAPAHGREP